MEVKNVRNPKGLNINQIVINHELKDKILEDINLFESKLEKAIYIYIKMCKLLTYDDEFFAVGQDNNYKVVKEHKSILNIKNITLKNNKIVCYDFNAIYLKLLNLIGIDVNVNYNTIEEYGKSHMNLTFKCDCFKVKADSVTSIINGDIYKAKLNQKLNGLVCLNENELAQKEFSRIVSNVYKKIREKESREGKVITKNKIEKMETLNDILKEYNIPSSLELDLYEKFSILIDKVNKTNLEGIDALSYLLEIEKILFTKEELGNNIRIVIIRNNEITTDKIKASAIIVINEEDLLNDYYDNEYYLYNPKNKLTYIDKVSLENKFFEGEYQYIINSSLRIPCLRLESKKKLILKK